MNELDCADVDAARRLRREENGEVASHFPRDHDLLLISARKSARRRGAGWRPDVEGRRSVVLAFSIIAILVEHAALREVLLHAEDQVVGDRVLEDESAAMPVFRNVRQACVVPRCDRAARDVNAVDQDVAAEDGSQAGDALRSARSGRCLRRRRCRVSRPA